ncbi:hypothetical protein IL252_09480 [Halomicrobium sp. IBSBa]|uniref:hypothetical protein n=1 Tax=Halomicrobium sp. IBSBa TaxID=2778916 RepID=UPI001ABF02C0|nr:hypothetical protein [Halomicrobium sp. IBSBa]MBO4248045.1 hypothetical protein [Halomicrobium sp. IBSBa]
MPAESPPSERRQSLVAALQWGLCCSFVVDSAASAVRNYYRATSEAFLPPQWVFVLQLATFPALLVGGVAGYSWLRTDRGITTTDAHQRRIRFTGALFAGWALAIVPTLLYQSVLGDGLYTVPWFLLPSLTSLFVLLIADVLGYRTDPGWYEQYRNVLLGAVQGALVGLCLGLVGFAIYTEYLLRSPARNVSVDAGPATIGLAVAGAAVCAGLNARYDGGDRASEFVTLLVLSVFGLSLATVPALFVLSAVGIPFGAAGGLVYPGLSTVCALLLATILAYRVRTNVYRRLTGQ